MQENFISHGPEIFISGAFASFFIVSLIVGLTNYVFTAVGLSSLAKINKYNDKAFLAWIPIANVYLLGILAEENNRTKYSGVQLAQFYIISVFLSAMPVLGVVFALMGTVAYVYILIYLFERMDFKDPVLMSLLASFVPFVLLFLIFSNRDKVFIY